MQKRLSGKVMIDRSTWTRIMAGVVSAGILAALLWPVKAVNYGHTHRTHCLSNVKQVTLGLIMYESDYDALPDRNWTEVSYPYTKSRLLYRCPEVKEGSGYAMNSHLMGGRLPKDPNVALIFETNDLTMGATSESLHPLQPRRHEDRLVIGFADGAAKMLPYGRTATVKMKPAVPAVK
ncbi:MAG: hypothetical protein ACO1SV_07205 [Fimbriimonas sp.]